MSEKQLRLAVAGAGTLLGKALVDEISSSAFASAELRLIDDDEAIGKLAAAGEEATFIHPVEPDSFEGCEFAFFAGTRELTRKSWRDALKAGCRVIDLSGELEGSPGVLLRAPWLQEESNANDSSAQAANPDLQTRVVACAHPVAVLLGLLSRRIQQLAPIQAFWATLLQPASEHGHAALEELHQQTTNLLSFQPLPTEVFGGQTAFNLAVSFGGEGRIALHETASVIARDFSIIAQGITPPALQIIQVPVFHGYAISAALQLAQPVTESALKRALAGAHVHIVPSVREFPGNVQAVEEDEVQLLIQPVPDAEKLEPASARDQALGRFWLWIVADNLKLAAKNAVACAAELNRLRPRGTVQ